VHKHGIILMETMFEGPTPPTSLPTLLVEVELRVVYTIVRFPPGREARVEERTGLKARILRVSSARRFVGRTEAALPLPTLPQDSRTAINGRGLRMAKG
jgi:hypothetical protein